MAVSIPPSVASYAVEELTRLRADLERFAATLDALAGQADVAGAPAEPVPVGPLLRGVASDVRRLTVAPGARRA